MVLFLAGIVCFLYAFGKLSFSRPPKQKQRKKTPPPKELGVSKTPSKPIHTPQKTSARKTSTTQQSPDLFNMKYPESKSNADFEERLIQERNIPHDFEVKPIPEIVEAPINDLSTKKDSPRRLKQRTGIVVLPGAEKGNTGGNATETGLKLTGILFLDYGKKIPFDNRKLKNIQWNEEFFTGFKRIGSATLFSKVESLDFSHEEELFRYPVEDLQQVIFYDHAFSFIPANDSLPVPVFFTEDIQLLKDYLASQF
ncbi:MAG: hypothetical protein AAF518_17085 [Spirochaetota bacterium]